MASAPPRPAGPSHALDALMAGRAGDPLRRALWLDALDRALRPALPPELAPHARLANVAGSRLVFLVDAPVWHAKLRLAGPGLLDAARSLGLQVEHVQVRTAATPVAAPVPARRRPIAMTQAAQAALQSALDALREPEPSGPPRRKS